MIAASGLRSFQAGFRPPRSRASRSALLKWAQRQPLSNSFSPGCGAEAAASLSLRVPEEEWTVPDGLQGDYTELLSRDCGDFVVRRADGVYAYQLAVSVDDMLMGVTRVVRGRDLLSSAPRQKWLIETLGGTAPDYCHCPLLTGGQGKLSKRLGSLSTQVLRKEKRPEEVVGQLAFLCGLTERCEPVAARELVPAFSWAKVKKEDILIE